MLWKAEWNSVVSPSTFFELRTGQFGYQWPDTPNGTGVSYEDLNTNVVSGKARTRSSTSSARRCSVRSAISGTTGRALTTSSSAASGSARRARLRRSPARTTTCCTFCAAARLRSHALRAREVGERSLHDRSLRAGHLAARQPADDESSASASTTTGTSCPSRSTRQVSSHRRHRLSGGRQPEHVEPLRSAHRRRASA